MLTIQDYQNALNVLDACNLSGVVHSFSQILTKIWDTPEAKAQGTDYVNFHPICVMYAEKIRELTRVDVGMRFSECYDIVSEIVAIKEL